MTEIPGAVERLFAERFGLETASLGRTRMERTVAAAMRRLGAGDQKTCRELLSRSREEQARCLEELVVPETWFFRDHEPFLFMKQYLRDHWYPAHCGETVRILSVPCSTGEEPYSIAMTLLGPDMPPLSFCIDAVDVSERALTMAREAVYGKPSFRSPLTTEQEMFFTQTPRGRKVADRAVQAVCFHHGNLIDPDFLAAREPYDLLFCRNVLIYMTEEAKRQVLAKLDRLLAPQGILFTGHAEMGFMQQNGYTAIPHPHAFACQRAEKAPAFITAPKISRSSLTASPLPEKRAVQSPAPARPSISPADDGLRDLLKEARAFADRGLFGEATDLCQKYLREHRPQAGIYCLLGLINEATDRSTEAEEYYLKALYLDPGHYEALIQTSLLYRRRGDDRKAALYRKRAEQLEGGTDGRKES